MTLDELKASAFVVGLKETERAIDRGEAGHVFIASEPDEEYPFTVCGQTVLLCNAALADAISVLPEQTREEILRYYFLRQPQRVIGACIGRSRSTAGRHIQLALQRLREEMGVSRYE